MATQRNTFQKRQRERDRQAKQAAKRAARLAKGDEELTEEELEERTAPAAPRDDAALLEELAEIHRLFDDKQIDFDTFEERKAGITAALAGD
jgi:hypothetical protein